MRSQLERELSEVLRQQASTTRRVPFTLAEIRDTSARIRRRRTVMTSAAIAVAAALVVPVLWLGGDDRTAPDPAPPSPTATTPAGLEAVSGPGVRVELSDAPRSSVDNAREEGTDLNYLLVHEPDIRAVVDAVTAAGSEAVTVNGQRIAGTTELTGQGAAVVIDGVPYRQPFVIEAVGDPRRLVRAIMDDDYLAAYRADASNPRVAVGWDLEVADRLFAPPYVPPE